MSVVSYNDLGIVYYFESQEHLDKALTYEKRDPNTERLLSLSSFACAIYSKHACLKNRYISMDLAKMLYDELNIKVKCISDLETLLDIGE